MLNFIITLEILIVINQLKFMIFNKFYQIIMRILGRKFERMCH